jgi:hypothetical protein
MIGVWNKVKLVVGAIFVALLPLFYVFGLRSGKDSAENASLKSAVRLEKDRAAFYRDLGELNEEIDRPRSRNELTDRLRNKGL